METIAPCQVMELLARAHALEARGRSVIDREVGEPGFPTGRTYPRRWPRSDDPTVVPHQSALPTALRSSHFHGPESAAHGSATD